MTAEHSERPAVPKRTNETPAGRRAGSDAGGSVDGTSGGKSGKTRDTPVERAIDAYVDIRRALKDPVPKWAIPPTV